MDTPWTFTAGRSHSVAKGLFLLLLACASGCAGSTADIGRGLPVPDGRFVGLDQGIQFMDRALSDAGLDIGISADAGPPTNAPSDSSIADAASTGNVDSVSGLDSRADRDAWGTSDAEPGVDALAVAPDASAPAPDTSTPLFVDVPASYWAFEEIQALGLLGISDGCGGGRFCPDHAVDRAMAAPLLLRAMEGSNYRPPSPTGAVFDDITPSTPFAAWIEELRLQGITGGCGDNKYCPEQPLTRAQAAVLVLRAALGTAYKPPPATGDAFDDVTADTPAAAWIEELSRRGLSGGCGGNNFCPNATTTRAQLAALIARAFAYV